MTLLYFECSNDKKNGGEEWPHTIYTQSQKIIHNHDYLPLTMVTPSSSSSSSAAAAAKVVEYIQYYTIHILDR